MLGSLQGKTCPLCEKEVENNNQNDESISLVDLETHLKTSCTKLQCPFGCEYHSSMAQAEACYIQHMDNEEPQPQPQPQPQPHPHPHEERWEYFSAEEDRIGQLFTLCMLFIVVWFILRPILQTIFSSVLRLFEPE